SLTPATAPADVRVARLASLYVPAGAAPSALTPPGLFRATFEGDINMRLRDFVFFSAVGRGRLLLAINGKSVLDLTGDFDKKLSESVRLNKGKNHLTAVYEPASNADAEFRLFWSTKYTLPEPVPPMVLTHSNAEKPV